MILNKQLKTDLEDLIIINNKDAIVSFFKNYDDEDEMIDKILLFGHYIMPHYLRDESPFFHRDLIARIMSKKNEYTAAPRGFSKTTVIQLCLIYICAHRLRNFIALIEKTATEASEVIKGVSDEFIDNEKINYYYGYLIGIGAEKDNGLITNSVKQKEAQGDVFINGVRIRGKGFNSTIRGLKTRQWRPDLIILDDVEEDEHINSPEQRQKYENNYNKGVQPAIDIIGAIKVFGTILHQDSLLKKLIDNHGGKIYKAYDPNDPENTLLWPSRWSFERLEQKKKDMMSAGQSTSAFAQEYLNDPVSEEDRSFKAEWLWELIPKPEDENQSYQVPKHRITMAEFEKIRLRTTLNGYAMIDAADATTANADYTGCVVVFVAPNGARFRVEVKREKRNVKGVIDLLFEVWERWSNKGLIKIGLEKKAFSDQILPLFEEEKNRRSVFPVIEELKPMGRNKENRIKGALQGFYEQGKIISVGNKNSQGYFIPVGHTNELLNELYDFPAAKNDDLSDAEAYQADIVVVPLADEEKKKLHHNPVDDPFEQDINPLNMDSAFQNVIANADDLEDVY